MLDRRSRIVGDAEQPGSLGIEIGALHSPLVRGHQGRVLYVDYAPTEVLRANFRHPGVDPAEIMDVDIVWGERPLREAVGEPADYILASHVIEHVPDLVGWLAELHGALRVGGMLGLAIPDRRFTFDVRRPVSSLGEVIEAYIEQHRRPSLCQIFDSAALSNDSGTDAWQLGEGRLGLPREVLDRLVPAFEQTKAAAGVTTYTDSHCWIFTPAAFLDIAQALAVLRLFPYELEAFFPTDPGNFEFYVRLRAVADAADPRIAASIGAMRGDPEVPPAVRVLRDEVAALVAGMEEMRGSTSWRLTAPIRTVGKLRKRFFLKKEPKTFFT